MTLDAYGAIREVVLQSAALDMMTESDAVTAADGTVYDAQARVFVNQLPEEFIEASDTFHPPKSIVVRMAGGFGKADLSPLEDLRVIVLAYGESDYEADRLRRAVYQAFTFDTARECSAGVYIHHINPAGGPIPLVEPGIAWPAVSQAFTFKADTEEAA